MIDIDTASQITITQLRLATDNAGVMVRDDEHVLTLDQVAMAIANAVDRTRRTSGSDPGRGSLAGVEILRRNQSRTTTGTTRSAVIDLSTYERAAREGNTCQETPSPALADDKFGPEHPRGRQPLLMLARTPRPTQVADGADHIADQISTALRPSAGR